MKMMFNQGSMGSALRYKKHPEPELRASHQDFMLEEMQDMAIDFQEETRSKRIIALQLSREAQREVARRVSVRLAEEQRLKEVEEQKKREKAVMQIDDILPDNINQLNKMASITGLLNESLNVGGGSNINMLDPHNGFFEDPGYQF